MKIQVAPESTRACIERDWKVLEISRVIGR